MEAPQVGQRFSASCPLSRPISAWMASSSASIGGIVTGLGVSPHRVGTIFGIVKAYTTRVGEGPFPT